MKIQTLEIHRESSRKRVKKDMGPDFLEYSGIFRPKEANRPPKTAPVLSVQVDIPAPLASLPVIKTSVKLNRLLKIRVKRKVDTPFSPALPTEPEKLENDSMDIMPHSIVCSENAKSSSEDGRVLVDSIPRLRLRKEIDSRWPSKILYKKHESDDEEAKMLENSNVVLSEKNSQPVTLCGVPANTDGLGSLKIKIPKKPGDLQHPLMTDTRNVPTNEAPVQKIKRRSRKDPGHVPADKATNDLRYGGRAHITLKKSIHVKLAAISGRSRGAVHTSEPVILTKRDKKRLRLRVEEDAELRQDMSLWSIEQCAAYFRESYPDLSRLITQHGLAGGALVVISRTQFLDLFQLPLGKALNMHAAVCRCRRMFF